MAYQPQRTANDNVGRVRSGMASQAAMLKEQRERNALYRLKMLQDEWTQNPGSAPGGTGRTGLAASDSIGYSKMLERQQEGLNLQRELSGKGPMNVEADYGPALAGLRSAARQGGGGGGGVVGLGPEAVALEAKLRNQPDDRYDSPQDAHLDYQQNLNKLKATTNQDLQLSAQQRYLLDPERSREENPEYAFQKELDWKRREARMPVELEMEPQTQRLRQMQSDRALEDDRIKAENLWRIQGSKADTARDVAGLRNEGQVGAATIRANASRDVAGTQADARWAATALQEARKLADAEFLNNMGKDGPFQQKYRELQERSPRGATNVGASEPAVGGTVPAGNAPTPAPAQAPQKPAGPPPPIGLAPPVRLAAPPPDEPATSSPFDRELVRPGASDWTGEAQTLVRNFKGASADEILWKIRQGATDFDPEKILPNEWPLLKAALEQAASAQMGAGYGSPAADRRTQENKGQRAPQWYGRFFPGR